MIKLCGLCDEPFTPVKNPVKAKYCKACVAEASRLRNKEWYAVRRKIPLTKSPTEYPRDKSCDSSGYF